METTRGCFSGGVMGPEEEATERQREWEEAAEAVAYDSCTMPPPIVAVCGPGNSGKSAFSRLLLNTLLQR
jgi:polynucleotide 5'-hydroxyl-kinase GRC3/NOL9